SGKEERHEATSSLSASRSIASGPLNVACRRYSGAQISSTTLRSPWLTTSSKNRRQMALFTAAGIASHSVPLATGCMLTPVYSLGHAAGSGDHSLGSAAAT